MALKGPLDQPRLRDIDEKLDAGALDEAARLLSALGDVALFRYATTFLATRLLYLRERLTPADVAQRLRELLRQVDYFPEARAMLAAAEEGSLEEFSTVDHSVSARHQGREDPSGAFDETTGAARVRAAIITSAAPRAAPLADEPGSGLSRSAPPAAGAARPGPLSLPIPAAPPSWDPGQGADSDVSGTAEPGATIPAVEHLRALPEIPSLEPPQRRAAAPEVEGPFKVASSAPPVLPSRPVSVPAPQYASATPPPFRPASSARVPSPAQHDAQEQQSSRQDGGNTEAETASDSFRSRSTVPPPSKTNSSAVPAPAQSSGPEQQARADDPKIYRRELSAPEFPVVPAIPRAPTLPQFDGAPGPPPVEAKEDFDPVKRRSQLPPRAGRYSETPIAPEVIVDEPRRRRRSQRPKATARPRSIHPTPNQEPIPRREPTPAPAHIRSGQLTSAPGVSLFELASLLDEERFDECLEAIETIDYQSNAEFSLLRARALLGAGRDSEAEGQLDTVERTPDLDPEIRAGVARLLAELHHLERALTQARRAYLDGRSSSTCLTYARLALKADRRREQPELVRDADAALTEVTTQAGPQLALWYGLRACVQACIGDSEKAISLAQRALGLDRDHPDALVALTLATARMGRHRDATGSWLALLDVDYEEADAISERVSALGIDLERASLRPPEHQLNWPDIEVALADDAPDAISRVELHAEQHLALLAKRNPSLDTPLLANLAAAYLSQAPGWQQFAPWDVSLWSIGRLDGAIACIYGYEPRQRTQQAPDALYRILGAYVGECLREPHSGRWDCPHGEPNKARVVSTHETWQPMAMVRSRIAQGSRLGLLDALALTLPDRDDRAWFHQLHTPIVPSSPWGGDTWPDPSLAPELGAILGHSVFARFARNTSTTAGSVLAFDSPSVRVLDRVLDSIAPSGAPTDSDPAWAPRVAALFGCFLGEVLRTQHSAEWRVDNEMPLGPHSYVLAFASGEEHLPVQAVWSRLAGGEDQRLGPWLEQALER